MNNTERTQNTTELGMPVKMYLSANSLHMQEKEGNLSHPYPLAQLLWMMLVRGEAKQT